MYLDTSCPCLLLLVKDQLMYISMFAWTNHDIDSLKVRPIVIELQNKNITLAVTPVSVPYKPIVPSESESDALPVPALV